MAFPVGYITSAQIDATVELLAEWGIDANWVAADGWDATGYDEFPRNPNTSRESKIVDPITRLAARVRRAWPEGFPVDELAEIRGGVGV